MGQLRYRPPTAGPPAWQRRSAQRFGERDVEAIITLFEEMINAEEIALAAYQNWNGADWYECPSCRKETKVKGHAFGTMHLIMGDHEDSCTAMKIYRALELRADTDD